MSFPLLSPEEPREQYHSYHRRGRRPAPSVPFGPSWRNRPTMLDCAVEARAHHRKILGEELGKSGRCYIALPPLLLIGFLIGLFFLAAAGQSRLNAANERVHNSQLRQQALREFRARITDP